MSKSNKASGQGHRISKYSGPREATLFRFGDRIIAVSTMITDISMPIVGGEVCIITAFEPERIGTAVRRVLAHFKVGVPHPDEKNWRTMERQFLKVVGFSSMRRFQHSAERRISVTDNGQLITILPNAKESKYGGFLPMDIEPEVMPSDAAVEDIGLAVSRAFDKCTMVST